MNLNMKQELILNECVERAKNIYKDEWDNGNPLSPDQFSLLISKEILIRFKELVELQLEEKQ